MSEHPANWTCTVSGWATALDAARQSLEVVLDEYGSTDPSYWLACVRTEWQDGKVVERFFYGDDQTGVLTEDPNAYREWPARRSAPAATGGASPEIPAE